MPVRGQIYISPAPLVASNVDVLAGTRLKSMPSGGILLIRLQADLNDASNGYTFSIEMPGGDTPVNSQRAPAGNPALGGVIDVRTAFVWSGAIQQGGGCIISATEVGTAILTVQVLFTPVIVRPG